MHATSILNKIRCKKLKRDFGLDLKQSENTKFKIELANYKY